MRLDLTLARLKRTGQTVMSTADVIAMLDVKKDHASHILTRLTDSGHFIKLKRGLWLLSDKGDPFFLAAYMTAPFPCYISLQSALYHHGMISQIPSATYCVSLARTTTYNTPAGIFSVHHISPDFFTGYSKTEGGINIAAPEKALIDMFYMSPAKTRLFAALPEIELPGNFSRKKAEQFINTIPSEQRRAMTRKRFHESGI